MACPQNNWGVAMYRLVSAVIAFAALTVVMPAAAQTWPSRPVRMIVPYAPGGSTDNAGRPFAEKLSQALGQQFVIDNRGGASGVIGFEAAMKSPPDGYTLLVAPLAPIAIIPNARKVPYDAFKDFVPVARIADQIFGMAVSPALGVNTVADFIALAKSKPGTLNFGSAGLGTTTQFSAEIFEQVAGIDMVHVPYKSSADALTDLLAGNIQVFFEGVVFPHAKAGTLKLLAVTTPDRHPGFPDVPTMRETLPNYEMSNWFGIMAPAGTPEEIVGKLNAALAQASKAPDLRERMLAVGLSPRADTPAEMRADMKKQSDRFAKIIKDLNIRLD